MTDSNINNLLNNNKEEENTNEQVLNTNEQSLDTSFENQIVNSSFTNEFKETNYTPNFDFDNYVNETLFDEETYDFAAQDFSITNNIFNDLTEEKPQKDLEITDNLLKYIGVTKYIKGEGSGFRVGWDDTRKPITRIKVEKILGSSTCSDIASEYSLKSSGFKNLPIMLIQLSIYYNTNLRGLTRYQNMNRITLSGLKGYIS